MVTLNGTDIHYEVYGKGEPLFLLHGFTQSSKSWLPFVSDYASDYEVYLIDLRGHGKSSQFTEKLSIKSVASDMRALVTYLKLDRINAIGYSYGGDVLFQLALLQPNLIKSMISIGACGSWDIDDFPDWLEFLSYKNIDNLPWMREQQTSEEQIRSILDQVVHYKIAVSDEEMKSIQARTLFVLGDLDDSIPLEYISRARKNLSNSYLWVLPNTAHGAHEGKNKADFVRVSKEFFSDSWSK
jgi:pimeloyl-ACP methyl ester carboxylesterase